MSDDDVYIKFNLQDIYDEEASQESNLDFNKAEETKLKKQLENPELDPLLSSQLD